MTVLQSLKIMWIGKGTPQPEKGKHCSHLQKKMSVMETVVWLVHFCLWKNAGVSPVGTHFWASEGGGSHQEESAWIDQPDYFVGLQTVGEQCKLLILTLAKFWTCLLQYSWIQLGHYSLRWRTTRWAKNRLDSWTQESRLWGHVWRPISRGYQRGVFWYLLCSISLSGV